MPPRKPPTPSLLDIIGDDSVQPSKPAPLDRQKVLETIGTSDRVDSFAELVEAAQRISVEMYLNQASICLQMQQDYLKRQALLLPIENFRTLKIVSDLMRELNAYDVSVDQSKAWELLERCGYKIDRFSSDTDEYIELDNFDPVEKPVEPLEDSETDDILEDG